MYPLELCKIELNNTFIVVEHKFLQNLVIIPVEQTLNKVFLLLKKFTFR